MEQSVPDHIVIVPSPGMGHLIPLVELAKLLLSRHGFFTTFLVPTIGEHPKAQISILEALPDNINYILLPLVDFSDLPSDVKAEIKIGLAPARSTPWIRGELSSLTTRTRVAAFVTDPFGMHCFDVAEEFGIPPYLYFTATATLLMFCCHLPDLDTKISCEYRDHPDPITLPGCAPILGKDLLDPVQDRKDPAYQFILQMSSMARARPEGIMVNSFIDLEPGPFQAFQEEEPGLPPVYPVGPMIRSWSGADDGQSQQHYCLRWLDDQPQGSVLFVSFGSGGTLSLNQLNELALGLESSEQRFLWVVRSPNEKSSSATFFSVQSEEDPFGFLPEGFVERTKGRGLVVASWAPQIKVLSHEATGGFLTHCGWNSTLESITHGVPLIAWPLYAEQKMNAVMLNEQIKVALRPKAADDHENGFVRREEIARVVKELMEGNEEGKGIRHRVKELSHAAKKALSDQGTSTKALHQLALKWKSRA
ncbi:hypothetical protein Dimus_006624 [Dionaea muscipula]